MNVSQMLIAAAVGGIVTGATGCGGGSKSGGDPEMQNATSQTEEAATSKHGCKGMNDCKGQGGCKTDKHACKGQNDCKGQGGCKM
jgi:hypothetical protein